MEDKTGGPAFPTPAHNLQNDGMTLRDYFAAKAMQAHLGNPKIQDALQKMELTPNKLAIGAYHWADEMLKARQE